MPHHLERLKSILVCPRCRQNLTYDEHSARCLACAAIYPIRNGRLYFISAPAGRDHLDGIKNRLKRLLGKYYYNIGVDVIAPTYPFNFAKTICRRLDPSTQVIVDVGSGNRRIHPDIICLDMFDYEAVDLICDLRDLPFEAQSVDAFVSRSVLEHVPEPSAIVGQFYEQTKTGGLGMHLIPFMFPFHASPYDFTRFTHKGQRRLFKDWEMVEQFNATGPVTLALLCFTEFLSIVLSFSNKTLKAYIYLLLCGLLFPVKYLDAPFIKRKRFLTLAPSILWVGRKVDHGPTP
jgi:hypothetical protein